MIYKELKPNFRVCQLDKNKARFFLKRQLIELKAQYGSLFMNPINQHLMAF